MYFKVCSNRLLLMSIIVVVVVMQHTGCLCGAVIALLKVPLSFQRYFFQKLQSTSIKVQQHIVCSL